MLGDLLVKRQKFSEAASSYRSAVKIDSLFYKPVFFNLANAEMMSSDYYNALLHFNVYLAQTGMSEKNKIIAAKNIKNCEFALNSIRNPVPFSPTSVGVAINTSDDEYWPSITADGQTLMFTRQTNTGERSYGFSSQQEDFYISYFSDNSWQKSN